ncbi:tetratricopeptide repeat protein [Streptomyces boluensis]|uniref:tetratricopeptide repeat protein n=1 Tax=Streptomyces boluensis TaxID=1775135 RepID=UPI001FEB6CD4|nr:tetratricopeptide repeat protein [Streptomyces boluensis]
MSLGPDVRSDGAAPRPGAPAAAGAPGAAESEVTAARKHARQYPGEPVVWARLADAEIETARTTLDAGRLDAADRALRRSLELDEGNYAAVTGRGKLANARHEFEQGRTYGLRSTRLAPDRPDGYAVLADAEIQLGNYPAARKAVQRMLDIDPGSAAYTRAAYDLETHGRTEDAAIALRRAAQSAGTPQETAFAEDRLGELAWSSGQLAGAQRHFSRALAAVPDHPYALAGLARWHGAHGRTKAALDHYDRLIQRTPVPQFLLEAVELGESDRHAGAATKAEVRGWRAALDAQVRMLRAAGGPVDPHLALYAADHGDPEVAVRLMREEWKHTRGVIAADAYAWALHRAGRDAEAVGYARKAAATGMRSALFRYHRGAIEKALGLPEADRHLREALALNRHFSPVHAPRATRMLAKGSESS